MSSSIALHLILVRQSLTLNQKLAISTRQASKLQASSGLCSPGIGLHTRAAVPGFLCVCWGFKLRSPGLCSQHSCYFLSPVIAVFRQVFSWQILGLSQRCQVSVEEATPTRGHLSSSVYNLGGSCWYLTYLFKLPLLSGLPRQL